MLYCNIHHASLTLDAHTVLTHIHLRCTPQTRLLIVGPPEAGKTSLLKLMAGLYTPTHGFIESNLNIGFTFQNNALFDTMTVYENIECAMLHFAYSESERRKQIVHLLETLNIEHAAQQYPAQLSGGMQKRVALARALIAKPNLCLLDEPTAGLDPVTSYDLLHFIFHEHTNMGVVIVSNDLSNVLGFVTHIALMQQGQLVCISETHPQHIKEHPALVNFMDGRASSAFVA